MKKYLPSKEFLKFFGIAVAIGLVIFLIIHFFGDRSKVSQEIQSIATRQIIEEQDTDNDGVKDWEEALWGLDLDNPDSDDDGILDGQEVEMRKQEIKNSEDFVEVLEEPKTETERLARQLTTIAFNLNQASGGALDQKKIEEIAAGLIEGVQPEMTITYTMEDIIVSPTKTAQEYYREMTQETGHLSDMYGTELGIVERAITLNKESILKELEPIIIAYSEAPGKVLKKEIPAEIAQAHLDYLNALMQKAIALYSLTQYFKDPIFSVRGMNEYVIAEENLENASNVIKNYLEKNGILR